MIEYGRMDLMHSSIADHDRFIEDALQTAQQQSQTGRVYSKTMLNIHGDAVIAFSDEKWTPEKVEEFDRYLADNIE